MFTIKAVIEPRSSDGEPSYQIYQAASIRVGSPRSESYPAPIRPAQCEVELLNDLRQAEVVLSVGEGLDHYQTVYIMNEQGKTVQSVHYHPSPR